MLDRDFGNWMAGFIDGEGCFFITRDTQRSVWRARFSLSLRSDDAPIIESMRAATGIGRTHLYKSVTGCHVVRWQLQSRPDCEELMRLLTLYPLRAKKRNDFEVWSRAVVAQREVRLGRADNTKVTATMAALKEELAVVRRKDIA